MTVPSDVEEVPIGGTSATITSSTWTTTSVEVTVPGSLTPGSNNVVVTSEGSPGTSSATYAVTVRADISGLSPATGTAGSAVTISGTNFGNDQGTSSVPIGGATATITN